MLRRLLFVAALACASGAPALAQTLVPAAVQTDPNATLVEELVVNARAPGPAWWRVSKGDAVVFVLGIPGLGPSGTVFDDTLLKKRLDGLDPEAQKLLMRYNWPGNIRELENAIERAALLAERSVVTADDLRLGDAAQGTTNSRESAVVRIPPTGIALEDVERQALTEALKMANWVQKDAADLLSISPRVMNYKIKTLGIDFPRSRRMPMGGAPMVM